MTAMVKAMAPVIRANRLDQPSAGRRVSSTTATSAAAYVATRRIARSRGMVPGVRQRLASPIVIRRAAASRERRCGGSTADPVLAHCRRFLV